MYQHKVGVDMLNAVKNVLAEVPSVSPSSEHSLWHSAYPHQPYFDTLYVLPPCRHRPKLDLTGTSIPF